MDLGLAQGIFTSNSRGIENEVNLGIDTGIINGIFNENLLPNSIVKNGLVLCLDASQNYSYPGSGATWSDLSGLGNNGTLTNGPTFNSSNGRSIVFDGVDDYCKGNNINVGNTFTINAWINLSVLGTSIKRATVMVDSYTYNNSKGFTFFGSFNNGSDMYISLGKDEKYALSTTGYIQKNTTCMVTARVNGTDLIRLYYNGNEVNYSLRTDANISLQYDVASLNIGGFINSLNNPQDMMNGKIYNIQLYNRGLSSTEILQNYNATKSRFGL